MFKYFLRNQKANKMLMFSHVSSVTYGDLSLKGDTTLMCTLHFRNWKCLVVYSFLVFYWLVFLHNSLCYDFIFIAANFPEMLLSEAYKELEEAVPWKMCVGWNLELINQYYTTCYVQLSCSIASTILLT